MVTNSLMNNAPFPSDFTNVKFPAGYQKASSTVNEIRLTGYSVRVRPARTFVWINKRALGLGGQSNKLKGTTDEALSLR